MTFPEHGAEITGELLNELLGELPGVLPGLLTGVTRWVTRCVNNYVTKWVTGRLKFCYHISYHVRYQVNINHKLIDDIYLSGWTETGSAVSPGLAGRIVLRHIGDNTSSVTSCQTLHKLSLMTCCSVPFVWQHNIKKTINKTNIKQITQTRDRRKRTNLID